MNPVALLPTETAQHQRPGLLRLADRQGEILLNTELLEHPWTLELAADSETGDAVFARPDQGATLEHNIPLRWNRLAGDDIKKGCLAGAIGTDHGPKFTRFKAEIEIAQSQKPVKADGDLTQLQQRLGHGCTSS